jgi:hypothetical protein
MRYQLHFMRLIYAGLMTQLLSSCNVLPSVNSTPRVSQKLIETIDLLSVQDEPKLEGVPLSCQIKYAQALKKWNLESEASNVGTDVHNRYQQGMLQILNTYIKAREYKAGLRFFEPGSLEWVQLAKLEISENPSKENISILENVLSGLTPDLRHQIMGELYLANGQSELALREWEPLPIGLKGWEPISAWRLAALFAKEGKQKQVDRLINPVLAIDDTDYPKRDLYLAQIVNAFVEAGLLEDSLQLSRRLSDAKGAQSVALNNIAQAYLLQGQKEKGLKLLNDANSMIFQHIDYVKKNRPATNVPVIDLENNIIGYAQADKYETALKYISSYDQMEEGQIGRIMLRISVAQKALKYQKIQLATEIVQQVSNLVVKTDFENKNIVKSQLLKNISKIYIEIKQSDRSKQLLAEAFNVLKQASPDDPDFTVNRSKILYSILTEYIQLGEYEKANQVADIELNKQEKNRLIQLVHCSTP